MEGIADVGDECTLLGNEIEFGGNITILALASLTANGNDGGIGSLCLFFNSDGGKSNFRIFLLPHGLSLEPLGGMALCLEFHTGKGNVFAVDVGECGR